MEPTSELNSDSPSPTRLRDWLAQAVRSDASDLHLIGGFPPVMRVHGDLTELLEPAVSVEG